MRKLLLSALPFVFCLPAFAAGPSRAPVLQIGELPGEKVPDLLRPKENNPFTRRETKIAEVAADRESEESKLRALFAGMSVTGVIRGGGAVKVLLESLILEQGESIPSLIEGQTERLVVARNTDTQVEIDFIEGDEHAEPRKILIPIDLRPRVAVRMPPIKIPATMKGATQPVSR
ncbi:MAG: hypothetical protein PHC88_12500 [Terrimicrobiaceae bacterium]|nr:hypothetical protein [Terrimicrobiaceae bacterium]